MLPCPLATEILSASGCDWLCIDLQHGQIGEREMRQMVAVAAIRHTAVLVRVPWNEPGPIMRALDAGADGVIVPMINSAADARTAAAACHFPPLGYRSWGPIRSTMAQRDYTPAVANEQVFCMVMVETIEAVERVDEIANTPGVHGIFVGPRDLAISHTGATVGAEDSPLYMEMVERVAAACKERDLVAGTICDGSQAARRWAAMGYRLIALQTDATFLSAGMAEQLAGARSESVV
jgi:4-hydroxy-2-oxoheptanedioate aldolase